MLSFRRVKQILLCSFLFCSGLSTAQQHLIKNEAIDSLTAVQTKTKANELSGAAFLKGSFASGTITLPYRLLLPPAGNTVQKYPLVIILHHSGKIGSDNEAQLDPLAKTWLREPVRNQYPAYVLAPQFAQRSSNYDPENGILVSKPSADVALVLELISLLEQQYPDIDRSRIYLMGYSMGGSTAQNLMSLDPQRFAALVSIAGVPDVSALQAFLHKPIWLIHGLQDDDNPCSGSAYLFQKLKGNKRLLFTTYAQLNHSNITVPFLQSDAIAKWLFRHHI